MNNEIWKYIEGSDNCYVSNTGKIKQGDKELPFKYEKTNGYYRCVIPGIGRERVHRVVAKAFIDNLENKKYVDHIDGCKTNNNASNLRYVTNSENLSAAGKQGLIKVTTHDKIDGKQPVLGVEINTKRFKVFESEKDASEYIGGDKSGTGVARSITQGRITKGWLFSKIDLSEKIKEMLSIIENKIIIDEVKD